MAPREEPWRHTPGAGVAPGVSAGAGRRDPALRGRRRPATLVHLGLLRLGVERLGISPVAANALAFSVAVAVTYLGQSLWVFRESRHSFARLRKFLVSVFAGLLANIGIMALAVQVFGLNYLVGFAAALVIVPITTFLINKFWVFS